MRWRTELSRSLSTSTDAAGNSASASTSFDLDTTADAEDGIGLAVTVDSVINDAESGSVAVALSGIDADVDLETGVVVTLTDVNDLSVSASYDALSGTWVADGTGLTDGDVMVDVQVTDDAGNTASAATSFYVEVDMQDYKGVVALQGDESTVDVGTNFFSNGYAATVVSEVTLDGKEHVQKYENAGWIQITPEAPIPVADLTTLHLSVFRTGGLHESWGSSEFRVKLVYDGAVEDNYTFSAPRGNEAVHDQWNNLEVPVSQLPGAQSGPDVAITDIILITERWFEGSLSGETVYLDGLAFSEKVSPEVIHEAPPTPADDAQDVIAIF